MSDQEKNTRQSFFANGNRKLAVFAIGSVLALSTAFGVQAFTDSRPYQHYKVEASYKGGWGHGRHHGWRHGRFADMTDAEIEKQIERMVKHAAIEIDATDEQQQKITALLVSAAKEIKPLRTSMMDSRQQIHDLLSADTIDREALEKLRADRLAEVDAASRTLVDTIAGVAEVLTAEQRQELDERIKEFRSFRHGWNRN